MIMCLFIPRAQQNCIENPWLAKLAGKMDLPEKWIYQKNGFTRKMDSPEKGIYQKNGFTI